MTISLVIISLTILSILLVGFCIYLKTSKKYTREKFAFYSLSAIITLCSTVIAQIFSSQSLISAGINTSNFFFKTDFASHQSDFRDYIIAIFIIWLVIRFILKIHNSWNGPVSETYFEKTKFRETINIFQESILQLKAFVSNKYSIKIHEDIDPLSNINIFSSSEDDKTPWHENVYELLTLYSRQYKIDLINDYYPEENLFISKYGQNNENVAILCCINKPSDDELKRFVEFVKAQKSSVIRFIVTIKTNEGKSELIKKYGVDIEYRYEDEMLESLIDFSPYYHFMKDQFMSREITPDTGITLNKIYVELSAHTESNEQITKIEKYIFEWLNENRDNKHIALLGEYGCGKSVLSLKITYELLEKRTKGSRIPILIELRGKSPRNLNVIEILSNWASIYHFDPVSLLKLHKAGKLLIIFEGFDEMDMIADREMRLNHFQRLWEFAIPKAKIIITGRPNFFLDDKELKTNLGIYKPHETSNSHYSEAIFLEKFNKDQIKEALRNIEDYTREQVLEILKRPDNSNFYDLISRPAILYLVAVIWKERKLSEYKNKINSAIVISEFIKYSYSRQSNKNILFPLTEQEREYFMLGIAVGMIKFSEYSNQISKNELETLILKLYRDFPDEISEVFTATSKTKKSLKERMVDNNQAEDTVLTDVRSCGILVNDLTRKDFFKFAHKSFLEYQVSLYFVESLLKDKGNYHIIMNAISHALDISFADVFHSPETMTFTAEILATKLKIQDPENQKDLCRELFGLLYPTNVLKKFPRLASYLDLFFANPMSIVFVISFVFVSVYSIQLLAFSPMSQSSLLSVTLPTIFVVLIFALTFPIFFRLFRSRLDRIWNIKRPSTKRGMIWLNCCYQLNISDKTILEVVSNKYLQYLKGEYTMGKFERLLSKLFGFR